MGSLDGRVAIVTGAGRGIGRSVALLLAREGSAVVVNDLGGAVDGSGSDAGPAQEVASEITAAGGRAVANGADVSDHAAAEDLVKSAISEFGKLDVLVNVAGILRDRMIFNMTEQEWDDVLRVHLKGTFNTSKFASAYWRSLRDETAQHRIINFTSVSGLHGAPGQPNYAAAKMGIVGLTWSCANALGKYGVTANAISPGAQTRMIDSIPTERRRSSHDQERSPDNIATVVAYLASERSGWITGRIVHSMGYEVSLYNNPEPIARLIGNQPWDLDGLADQMERSFGPIVGRPRRAAEWRPAGQRASTARSKAVPVPTPETQPFWDGCAAGELRLQRCLDCGKPYFYPRPACPACGSPNVEWFTASGDATLYSYVISHRPARGFEDDGPYAIAVVELAEGPRMMTSLAGVPPPRRTSCWTCPCGWRSSRAAT